MIGTASAPSRPWCSCRSAPRATSGASSTWSHMRGPGLGRRAWARSGDRAPIPADLKRGRRLARHQLIDVVANHDDTIMEKYLGEEEITADDLRRALRKATLASQAVPVLCGSAFKNKGVQPLLDAVVDYLPSPLDVPPVIGHRRPQGGRRSSARPTTPSPSPPWPSRS